MPDSAQSNRHYANALDVDARLEQGIGGLFEEKKRKEKRNEMKRKFDSCQPSGVALNIKAPLEPLVHADGFMTFGGL